MLALDGVPFEGAWYADRRVPHQALADGLHLRKIRVCVAAVQFPCDRNVTRTSTVPLPRRLADTTVARLTLIRRHQQIHDFCLRTAAVLEKPLGAARFVRTILETHRPPVAPCGERIARSC